MNRCSGERFIEWSARILYDTSCSIIQVQSIDPQSGRETDGLERADEGIERSTAIGNGLCLVVKDACVH